MSQLQDRVVAIAGATGGLGPEVARACAAAGAKVALSGRDQTTLDALLEQLDLPSERVDARVVDLLDEDAAREWAAALNARFGGVDAVAHLIGGWRGGTTLADAPLEDWVLLHDLLIRTVQHTTRAFSDALLTSGRGRFVLVSSKQAQAPSHDNAAYAAAKAAAEAWTLAYADAFAQAKADATANIVVINAIVTAAQRAAEPDRAFRTFTDASEIADAIVYLFSDAARKSNGARLHLHGA